eukprot:scaffold40885_cov36-Cyclotella_meneghiniana.AAC.3
MGSGKGGEKGKNLSGRKEGQLPSFLPCDASRHAAARRQSASQPKIPLSVATHSLLIKEASQTHRQPIDSHPITTTTASATAPYHRKRDAMSSSDIPSLLLQSTDARIAEAAKRVFSSHPIAPSAAKATSAVTRPSTMSCSPHYSFVYDREQHYTNKRKAAVDVTACASTESTKHAVVKKRSFDNNSNPTTTNVDEQFELEEDKKLSSTERLQR